MNLYQVNSKKNIYAEKNTTFNLLRSSGKRFALKCPTSKIPWITSAYVDIDNESEN